MNGRRPLHCRRRHKAHDQEATATVGHQHPPRAVVAAKSEPDLELSGGEEKV